MNCSDSSVAAVMITVDFNSLGCRTIMCHRTSKPLGVSNFFDEEDDEAEPTLFAAN